MAAQLRRGVLHDRVGRARGQRGGGGGGAADRPGAAALPVGRRSTAPGPAQVGGAGPDPRRAARASSPPSTEPIAGGRHKVFGHPELAVDPDDLDDRLAPAAGGRPGVRDRAGPAAGRRRPASPRRPATAAAAGVARRRDRGLLVRRRVGQPRRGRRRPSTPPAGSTTAAPGVPVLFVCEDNGLGISVRSPEGWVRGGAASPAGPALLQRADGCDLRRDVRRGRGGGRLGARRAAAGRAAPEHGPADGPRRRGRRGRRTARRGDRGRPGPRPARRDRRRCSSTPACSARTRCSPATTRSAGRCAGSPRRSSPSPSWPAPAEVVAPLAPRRPVRVARAVADGGDAAAGPGRPAPVRGVRRQAAGEGRPADPGADHQRHAHRRAA